MATHIERTRRLGRGETLSGVTSYLAERLGVRHRIVPMSDDCVRTFIETAQGTIEFQDYFVRLQCEPTILSLEYRGAAAAAPTAFLTELLQADNIDAIIICPSNPLLSIEPILSVTGMRHAIGTHHAPKIAISPIVAGRAIKGPAARNFKDLGIECSPLGVARYYDKLIDGIIIDQQDRQLSDAIESLDISVVVTNTLMTDESSRLHLAKVALDFASRLGRSRATAL
jgi:LPPG:FO 2-phospho-L-lactate transferase